MSREKNYIFLVLITNEFFVIDVLNNCQRWMIPGESRINSKRFQFVKTVQWIARLIYPAHAKVIQIVATKMNKFILYFIGFLYCWASFVLLVTFSVGFFKKEKYRVEDEHKKISVFQNYKLLWDVLRVPGIKVLAVALLTTTVNIKRHYIIK